MGSMSQNFRLFHVSNLSVLNFRILLLVYPVSVSPQRKHRGRSNGTGPGTTQDHPDGEDDNHRRGAV